MSEKVEAVPVQVFSSKEDAQAAADAQRGKVFYRYWSIEEMMKNTIGWQEAYDDEQARGEPRWATRLLELWKTQPQDMLARDEQPADKVYEQKDGTFVVPAKLEEVSEQVFDVPQNRLVTAITYRPADTAVKVDGSVLVAEDKEAADGERK